MADLLWLFDRLKTSGEILEDKLRLDSTGAWRSTTYRYDGVKFFVLVHDGKLVGIW